MYQFTFPQTVQECSFFSTPSPAFIFCRLFDDGHSDQYEMISCCGFDLHISNNENWCFWSLVLEKTLKSPLNCREIQLGLKEISPEYSLEGPMLKLNHQYLGHVMWRTDSFEKTLMLGKIEGGKRRWWQRMRRLDGITDSMDMGLGGLRGLGMDRENLACSDSLGCKESDTTEWLNWTELNNEWCWASFHVFINHLYVFFGEMSV